MFDTTKRIPHPFNSFAIVITNFHHGIDWQNMVSAAELKRTYILHLKYNCRDLI